MPENTILRRQASCCFFTCVICLSLALLTAGTAVRLIPADVWEASIGAGVLLQAAAVVLYAVTRRKKRIFRIIGILLNTLGVGLIMAAHPLAADFRLTAQTLSLCAVPAAVPAGKSRAKPKRICREGEPVEGGYIVQEIGTDHVVLARGSEKQILPLRKKQEKKP